MLANYFYNKTTRKYVALFGTYFNQLKVCRYDSSGNAVHDFIVPISYAPWEKILARVTGDPEFVKKAQIVLPRMSFEITNITHDPTRKISPTRKLRKTVPDADTGVRNFMYAPSPYNFNFSLYVMAKYSEDAIQIVEQILPFFRPDLTNTVTIVNGVDPMDIPLILDSVTSEEVYEGDFNTAKTILWTLTFTMKGWFFGPEREKKVIKFIDADLAADTALNTNFEENYSLQPGLTAEGNPTTQLAESINYQLINYDDDYGYIENQVQPSGQEMLVTLDQSLMTANTATITVPYSGQYFTIDWGDGTNELTELADGTANTVLTHTYINSGTYDVKLNFVDSWIQFDDSLIDIKWWGGNTIRSGEAMFKGNENLVTFTAPDVPNFLPASSTASMFEDCSNFTGAGSNLGDWDLSNVTNTTDMFKNTG